MKALLQCCISCYTYQWCGSFCRKDVSKPRHLIWCQQSITFLLPPPPHAWQPPSLTTHNPHTDTSTADDAHTHNDHDNEDWQRWWCPTNGATTKPLTWHTNGESDCAMSTAIFRMTNTHDARPHNGMTMTTPPPPLMLTDHEQCPCSMSTQPRWVTKPGPPMIFSYGNQVPHHWQQCGNWMMNDDMWSSFIVVYTMTLVSTPLPTFILTHPPTDHPQQTTPMDDNPHKWQPSTHKWQPSTTKNNPAPWTWHGCDQDPRWWADDHMWRWANDDMQQPHTDTCEHNSDKGQPGDNKTWQWRVTPTQDNNGQGLSTTAHEQQWASPLLTTPLFLQHLPSPSHPLFIPFPFTIPLPSPSLYHPPSIPLPLPSPFHPPPFTIHLTFNPFL